MNLNHLFPLTTMIRRGQPKTLVLAVCIYLAASAVVKIVDWLVGWLPLLGAVIWALQWLVGLYCVAGIVVAVLEYFRGTD